MNLYKKLLLAEVPLAIALGSGVRRFRHSYLIPRLAFTAHPQRQLSKRSRSPAGERGYRTNG